MTNEPTTIQDDFFGPITWMKRGGYFYGSIPNGNGAKVLISAENESDLASVTQARSICKKVHGQEPALRARAARDVAKKTPAKMWGGKAPSAEELEKKMRFDSISIYLGGGASVYYEGVDVEHGIKVELKKDYAFRTANLQ